MSYENIYDVNTLLGHLYIRDVYSSTAHESTGDTIYKRCSSGQLIPVVQLILVASRQTSVKSEASRVPNWKNQTSHAFIA